MGKTHTRRLRRRTGRRALLCVAITALLAGGLTAVSPISPAAAAPGDNPETFTANGTYTVPTGATVVKIEAIGGGGGGGASNGSTGGTGGKGATVTTYQPVSGVASLAVTVGNGGGAGAVATSAAAAATGYGDGGRGGSTANSRTRGGGGGGSTAVVVGADQIVAGGGGGGGGANTANAGNGGNAAGGNTAAGSNGTAGGGVAGAGANGTGAAGTGLTGSGTDGAAGVGGTSDCGPGAQSRPCGGGGGGGYGGGAAGAQAGTTSAGGGGAGGSKTTSNATSVSYAAASGAPGAGGAAQTAGSNGQVVITAINPATINSAVAGPGTATITWTEPSQPVGVTASYRVYQDGVAVSGAAATTSPAVISGLTAGQQYAFTVVGTSTDGMESTSTTSNVTPTALPLTKNCITYAVAGATATVTGFTNDGCFTDTLTIPATVPDNGASVTAIGAEALREIGVATLVMPSSVTTIGYAALYDASSLTSVTYPTSLTSIGDYAFKGTNITSLTTPSGLTSIGEGAFQDVTTLSSVTFNSGLLSIGLSAFNNTRITSANIPNSVTTLGISAFSDNPSLTSATIGTGLTSIPEAAFRTTGLTAISIPANVTSIGDGAFQDVTALTTVTLNSGLLSIGLSAFNNTRITSANIPNSVTTLGISAFSDNPSLTSATIGSGVTTLPESIFRSNSLLQSVHLPFGLVTIGPSAFQETGLTAIYIPDSVSTIGDYAFTGIGSSLRRVTFGASVANIGQEAFAGSTNMSNVLFVGAEPTLGADAFLNTGSSVWHLGQNASVFGSTFEGHAMAAAGPPVAGTFTPITGNSTGGTEVTADASGAFYGAVIKIGGELCTNGQNVLNPGDTTISVITCDSPAGSGTDPVDIVNPDQQTGRYSTSFAYNSTPGIAVSPTSKSFGSRAIQDGPTATQTFTVTSDGGGPLVIGASAVTLTGTNADQDQFEITSDLCSSQSISPGGTCTVGVRFDPTTTGAKAADLSIASNDGGSPELIPLTGTGTTNAPVNTVAPALSGTATTGQTLSVTPGTWTGNPSPTYGYQWRTCTTSNCSGGTITDIAGATSSTYLLTNNEVGKYVQAVVTGTNGSGSAAAASNPTATTITAAAPGAPTILTPSPGSGSATVFWSAPASNGGSAITGYKIEQSDAAGIVWLEINADTGNTNTSYSVSGLTNGTGYKFRVSAINAVDTGAESGASNTVTPSADVFVSSWKTDNVDSGSSAADTIILPLTDGEVDGVTNDYDFTVYWGDGTSSAVTDAAGGTHTYAEAGTYTVSIVGTIKGFRFGWDGIDPEAQDREKLLDISNWGTLNLGNGGAYFRGARNFNATATDVLDLTGTTSLDEAFSDAESFNGAIGNWDTSGVTSMRSVFNGAADFNQDIGDWNTANVLFMSFMFYNASAFNQDIGDWNTSKVIVMDLTFYGASDFNQDIGGWNTASLINTNSTFRNATAFDQDLSGWDVDNVTNASNMFTGVTLSTQNYSNLLQGWAAQNVKSTVTFSGGSSKYYVGPPTVSRAILTGAPKLWTITDGGQSTTPGAPTGVSGVGQNTAVAVEWNAAPLPVSGAPVTSYTVTARVGGVAVDPAKTCTTATFACTVSGLTNDVAYTFTVTATNTAGTGPASAPSAAVTPAITAPGAPTILTPSPGNGSATVFWNAPVSDGGSAITGYKIEQSDAAGIVWSTINANTGSTNTSYSVSGLTNGTGYKFRVSAINAVDAGVASGVSGTVTPSADVFVSEWDTTASGTSTDHQVALPLQGCDVEEYDFTVYWGDGTSQDVMSGGPLLHTYDDPGSKVISITGTIKGFSFDNGGDALKFLNVSQWGSLNLGNCGGNFYGAQALTVSASDAPDLAGVTTLQDAFNNADSFNSDITHWDTSGVENFRRMFAETTIFNQPLSALKTASATDMAEMFVNTTAFNSALVPTSGGWDLDGVLQTSSMFRGAAAFNQDISAWDTHTVVLMNSMFAFTDAFNQPIGAWDTSAVTSMTYMFEGAAEFDQDIGSWNVSSVGDMADMFEGTGLSTANYNALLAGWSGQTVGTGVDFDAGTSKYSAGTPTTDRAALTGAKSWVITDGGQSPVPNAPTNVAGTGGNLKINVTWDAAAAPSGDAVTSYTATASPDGQACTTPDGVTLGCQITGLTNSQSYTVTVVATNGAGAGLTSEPSASITVNSIAPVNTVAPELSGTATTGQTLSVTDGTWTGDPSPTYGYQWRTCTTSNCSGGTITNIADATNPTYLLTNSEVGKYVQAVVTGTNSAGSAAGASNPTATTIAAVAPGAPGSAAAQPLNASAKVTWTVPSNNGGSAVTGYNVYRASSTLGYTDWESIATPGNVLTYTDTTVANGTSYRYRVYAINTIGTGASDAETEIVTPSTSIFVSTWKTDNEGSGPATVVLPLAAGTFGGVTNSYSFTAYWGDGTSTPVDNSNWASARTHTYASAGTYTVSVVGTLKGFSFGNGGDRLKLLDISNWGSLNFGNAGDYFYGAANFNATATDEPDLTGTTSLARTFREATSFNANISNWNTVAVTDVGEMFDAYDAEAPSSFNQPLTTTVDGWNTSNMVDMGNMFRKASVFNQDISSWDTSSAQRMNGMFWEASAFNSDLSGWDTADVTVMGRMFDGATQFSADLSDWDTGAVTELAWMFRGATVFNSDVSGWDTSSATDMRYMFDGASAFNQNLGQWNVGALQSDGDSNYGAENMLNGTALSTVNYDALLVGWAGQTVGSGIHLGVGDVAYSVGAPTTARAVLTGGSNSWVISDGGQSLAPGAPTGVTGVGQNAAVTVSWDAAPVPGANPVTSYTVTASPGGSQCTTATLSCTVTGLDNGTGYTFTVVAANLDGDGPASAPSAEVTANPISPVNTVAPVLSGTATTGQTLSVTNGTWTGDPSPTYGYQWRTCTTADCTGGTIVDIAGATSATFVLTNAQIGSYVQAVVTGTNVAGASDAASNVTATTTAGIAPVNTVAPVVSGTPTTGQTLSVTTGTWSGQPAPGFTYQWRTCTTADCTGGTITNITGATSATYVLTNNEIGDYVQAVVTGTNVAGASDAASNVTATTTAGIAPVNTVAPVVSGTPTTGQTLTATTGTWSGQPAPGFTYQWRTCTTADCTGGTNTDIAGATSATFVLTNTQIGKYVQAVVTATNVAGATDAASTITAQVAAFVGLLPALSTATSTFSGYTFTITNYDAQYTWTAASTVGSAAIRPGAGGTTIVTVIGLEPGQQAQTTITTTRAGYTTRSAARTGTAQTAEPILDVAPAVTQFVVGQAAKVNASVGTKQSSSSRSNRSTTGTVSVYLNGALGCTAHITNGTGSCFVVIRRAGLQVFTGSYRGSIDGVPVTDLESKETAKDRGTAATISIARATGRAVGRCSIFRLQGRTQSQRARVVIQQKTARGWRVVKITRSNRTNWHAAIKTSTPRMALRATDGRSWTAVVGIVVKRARGDVRC